MAKGKAVALLEIKTETFGRGYQEGYFVNAT